jgi:hypothetical protein
VVLEILLLLAHHKAIAAVKAKLMRLLIVMAVVEAVLLKLVA